MAYSTIVADPPWDYGRDHKRWPRSPKGKMLHGGIPYEPMESAEIIDLPVDQWTASDARLFLWTTSKHLPLALEVLSAWGFDYKQTLVWHKTGNPSPFGGSVAPNHAEFLLVAVKGAPPLLSRLKGSVIAAAKPNHGKQTPHSRKPEIFQDEIERCSPGPYLELFARRERLGWKTWGNESANSAGLFLAA